jgi:hypothetical protein
MCSLMKKYQKPRLVILLRMTKNLTYDVDQEEIQERV